MTADDLKNYKPVERTPLRGTYHGYDIVSMPPPSSGGMLLMQMLNILEGFKLRANDPSITASDDRNDEACLRRPRAVHGRSRFHKGAGDGADIEEAMRRRSRAGIDRDRAKPPRDIAPGNPLPFEGANTTHYSVVDRFGNAVSNTYTINDSYGVGLVAEGTGMLLNNELDDFAAKPDAPNAFGLIGLNEANAPGPNKRPLSSMTPTIVFKDGKPVLVTGSPGGSRIITVVLQVVVNVIDHQHEHRRRRRMRHASIINGCRTGRGRAHMPSAMVAGARSARPQDRAPAAADLGKFDHDNRARARRRRRPAHARGAGGGILKLNWFALVRIANRSASGAKVGAGEGIRTLDPDLGKVVDGQFPANARYRSKAVSR